MSGVEILVGTEVAGSHGFGVGFGMVGAGVGRVGDRVGLRGIGIGKGGGGRTWISIINCIHRHVYRV